MIWRGGVLEVSRGENGRHLCMNTKKRGVRGSQPFDAVTDHFKSVFASSPFPRSKTFGLSIIFVVIQSLLPYSKDLHLPLSGTRLPRQSSQRLAKQA